MPSRRAAMLTPSPIRSPSLSSTTSPRWMPTRNSMRRSGGRPALRSTMPFCTSMAQRTASTTLRNSMRTAVAGPLHDAAVMHGDGGIDQIAPERPQPRKRPLLVGASKLAVSDHIRRKNGCEFPGLRHGSPSPQGRVAQLIVQDWSVDWLTPEAAHQQAFRRASARSLLRPDCTLRGCS